MPRPYVRALAAAGPLNRVKLLKEPVTRDDRYRTVHRAPPDAAEPPQQAGGVVEPTRSGTGPAATLDPPGASRDLPPAPRSPAARRKGEPRPVPRRDDAYGHLSLDELRAYRKALTDEEGRVSYWRRILQARLDVVRAGATGRELDTARLRPVLTSERVGAGRQALVDVLPADDIPPLPSLAELWERRTDAADPVALERFERDLVAAEVELSAYRSALHRRISDATGELIARYREEPGLCLSALPGDPARSRAL